MAITAGMVKELREMTGAGMMDCKKALTATDGDMDAAVQWLRENGLAKAAKKESRIAAEGVCSVYVTEDGKVASLVEVNSETDFVAKIDTFQAFVAKVAEQAASTNAADIDAFLAEPWCEDASISVKDAQSNLIAVIGEKLSIRRFAKIDAAAMLIALASPLIKASLGISWNFFNGIASVNIYSGLTFKASIASCIPFLDAS